jgi:hypothetical protein
MGIFQDDRRSFVCDFADRLGLRTGEGRRDHTRNHNERTDNTSQGPRTQMVIIRRFRRRAGLLKACEDKG